MKRIYNYVLIICLVCLLSSCGLFKSSSEKTELPVQDFSQTSISMGNLDGYKMQVVNCIGFKNSQVVYLYVVFKHEIANHDIAFNNREAFSEWGDEYVYSITNNLSSSEWENRVTCSTRTNEVKTLCMRIESVLPSVDKISTFILGSYVTYPNSKSSEIIIRNIPIAWQ